MLLRAINVGGHNKVPMAELRELLTELGFDDVATYIQSGNIVCSSRKGPTRVGEEIRKGIAERFGHDIAVLVRTQADIAQVIEAWPYVDADPKRSGVVFMDGTVDAALDASGFAPEECVADGENVFMLCPLGFADAKLSPAWIEKQTGRIGTRRNWNTVLKLSDMLT